MIIDKILKSYKTDFSEKKIKSEIQRILNQYYDKLFTVENLKNIFSCIDLTSLNVSDTKQKIEQLIEKVNQFDNHFPDYKNVAGICTYPNFIETIKEKLLPKNVKIISVAGSFPASQSFMKIKQKECELTVESGAQEIDIVINVGETKNANYQRVYDELVILKKACSKTTLKVILETGELNTPEFIHNASLIALYAGADFIKTSTGKVAVNATLEAAYLMCNAIKEFYKKTNQKRGFKAAGGISSAEKAIEFYVLINHILGKEWLSNKFFRIGASSLCNNLLSTIQNFENENIPIKYF